MCNCCGNNNNNGNNNVEAASTGAVCCYADNPFLSDRRVCCDCDGTCCGCFDSNRRDCFWPEFTHPSWLCCDILYSCAKLPENVCGMEDPINAEDRWDRNACKKCKKDKKDDKRKRDRD